MMQDQFVDSLFARLSAERDEAAAKAVRVTQVRERVEAHARAWWDAFCQAVDSKVRVWNAKDAAAVIQCARTPTGSVTLWHPSVEAELRLAECRIVMTGRIGNTRPRESPFIEFNETRGAPVAVLASDSTTKSPAEAAEHVLGPIFTRAFADAVAEAAARGHAIDTSEDL